MPSNEHTQIKVRNAWKDQLQQASSESLQQALCFQTSDRIQKIIRSTSAENLDNVLVKLKKSGAGYESKHSVEGVGLLRLPVANLLNRLIAIILFSININT